MSKSIPKRAIPKPPPRRIAPRIAAASAALAIVGGAVGLGVMPAQADGSPDIMPAPSAVPATTTSGLTGPESIPVGSDADVSWQWQGSVVAGGGALNSDFVARTAAGDLMRYQLDESKPEDAPKWVPWVTDDGVQLTVENTHLRTDEQDQMGTWAPHELGGWWRKAAVDFLLGPYLNDPEAESARTRLEAVNPDSIAGYNDASARLPWNLATTDAASELWADLGAFTDAGEENSLMDRDDFAELFMRVQAFRDLPSSAAGFGTLEPEACLSYFGDEAGGDGIYCVDESATTRVLSGTPSRLKSTGGESQGSSPEGITSHAAVVEGELLTWGDNAHGQLGLGDTEPRSEPTRVEIALGDEPWIGFIVEPYLWGKDPLFADVFLMIETPETGQEWRAGTVDSREDGSLAAWSSSSPIASTVEVTAGGDYSYPDQPPWNWGARNFAPDAALVGPVAHKGDALDRATAAPIAAEAAPGDTNFVEGSMGRISEAAFSATATVTLPQAGWYAVQITDELGSVDTHWIHAIGAPDRAPVAPPVVSG